jgi:DNA polymerase-1
MFRRKPGYHMADGTGFVRLCGITGPSGSNLIVPVGQLLAMLGAADSLYGHNIMGFDGLALAWHEGMDWDAFCAKARDTELIARQYWPPRSREKGHSEDKYGLDAVAALIGVPGKTDSFKDLAKKWGDADKIPVDDAEFRAYLNGDLDATRAVYGFLARCYDSDPYLPREHRLAQIAGHMRLNGLGVDAVLLEERYQAGERKKAQALQALHDQWGLPLGRSELKGRGAREHFVDTEFESPLATGEGQAWLEAQWDRWQIDDAPRTGKTARLAIGSDELDEIAARPDCPDELKLMITCMTTTRTVYQTAKAWLCPDGRVHPSISFRQASGRWSVTEPGLTVFGKHEGRHVERDIFVARPGYSLWSFDLEQVDMRAIAGHCQDHAYMDLFRPGRDAHSEIAARVFGEMPRDEKGRHPRRQDAKARGHGWNYGMGPERMIRDGVDPDMAYAFDNGMTEGFPVLCDWREQVRAIARGGGILDNGFGRRMRADPRFAYTVAPALMGQGGARDILGACMLRLDPALYQYLLMQVHDELIFELPDNEADEAVHAIRGAMEGEFRGVPILVDQAGPGRSWGEISAK